MTQSVLPCRPRRIVVWSAFHNVLVDRNDSNVVKNGFAQRAMREIRLVVHLGQHDIHIITRPDQARDAELRVDVDADGAGIRGQDAGEETPISRAQDVLRCDGTAGVEELANQRTAKSDPGVGRIKDRP